MNEIKKACVIKYLVLFNIYCNGQVSQSATSWNETGALRFEFNDFKRALHEFDKAIKIKPDFSEAYLNRGIVKYTLGNYKGSLEDCDKVELKPGYTIAYNNKIIAKDDSKGSCIDWKKALELGFNKASMKIKISCN